MSNKPRRREYDWVRAIVSLAATKSSNLSELASAAQLDPLAGDLSDIDLSNLDLSGQDLRGWDLRHARFSNAKLKQTQLRNALVDPAELIRADDWQVADLDEHVRQEAYRLQLYDGLPFNPANPAYLKKVDELEFTARTAGCLKNDNVVYIGDLVQKTEAEMLRIQGLGRKSLNEVKEVLAQMGLHLGMEISGWPPADVEELSKKFEDHY